MNVCCGLPLQLRLVAPGSWRTVARQQLLPAEVATCLRCVHLTASRSKATQPLIAVGTSFSAGVPPPESAPDLHWVLSQRAAPPDGSNSVCQCEAVQTRICASQVA